MLSTSAPNIRSKIIKVGGLRVISGGPFLLVEKAEGSVRSFEAIGKHPV